MIHGRNIQRKRRRARLVALVVTVGIAVALLGVAWGSASAEAEAQGAQSVRNAVMDAAMQCAAVEGSYPPSLQYLENNYGLIVNDEDYAVTYVAFASNLPPSVVVVPR